PAGITEDVDVVAPGPRRLARRRDVGGGAAAGRAARDPARHVGGVGGDRGRVREAAAEGRADAGPGAAAPQRDRPAGQPAPAPAPRVSFERLRADAVARLESSHWAGARIALEEALRRRPADVYTRYLLGVALSNLDLQDHAAEAFAWVVAYGSPRSEYVGLARQWLVLAGVLRARTTDVAAAGESSQATGRLRGRTSWLPTDDAQVTLRLTLEGSGATTA